MADQALAKGGPITPPEMPISASRRRLCDRVRRGWNLGRCLSAYLLSGANGGVGGLVNFVVGDHFFYAIQVPTELTALGEILAALRPERSLEIGTAHGGTLFFLTRLASPQATIVSVDLPGGEFGGGYGPLRRLFYQRFAKRGQRVCLLQGDSHSRGMLGRVETALGERKLDYLFIDGDHRYEGVMSDFEMYGPLVRTGGLIAFHDIVDGSAENVGGVPRFWREVKSRHRYEEIIDDVQQGGCGIGVLYVD